MQQPNKLASDIRRNYFRQNIPEDIAEQIVNKVLVNPRSHKWKSENLANQAEHVIKQARFDIDDLAENHLGLKVSFENLEYMDVINNTPVFGVAYPDSKEFIICERTLKYEPLYRSTVAHEIGHCCLHKSHAFRSLLFTPKIEHPNPEEIEANIFMTNLLIPPSLLKLAISYCCHLWDIDRGIDIRLVFAGANSKRGRWLWKEKVLAFLINNFCVSRHMLLIQMKKFGIFSEDTVAYHKTYPLETKWHKPTDQPVSRIGTVIASFLKSGKLKVSGTFSPS